MISNIIFAAAGVFFAAAAIIAIIRIITGPTILDRIVASDMLVTTLMLAVGAEMIYHKHTDTIILMIVLAATSFLGTVIVARHVRRRDRERFAMHEAVKNV